MPRSPSPDRRSEQSHPSSSRTGSRRDPVREASPADRRRSRSPARRREDRHADRRSSHRDDGGKLRDRGTSRSRSRDRERDRRGDRRSDRDWDHRSSRRERSRSRDRSERDHRSSHHRSSRRRSRSRSNSPDSADSGSDSDRSRSRDRDRRHRRRRSRSRSPRDRDDKERRRRREEKKARRAKREEKKRAKKGLQTVQWGAHGILTEADRYNKTDEFHAWLIGEKMLNPETLSKAKEKEIFPQFMEDFNTCTLPHEKYYDIAKWEKQMAAVRMGETVEKTDGYDWRKDEESARASYRRTAASSANSIADQLMDPAKLQELRRIQAERIVKEKSQRLGITVSDKLGVRTEDKMRD